MEKIYMEEKQNQNNNKGRRSLQSSTSIMMSFILAFVSIVSIAAYAFGRTSFAIPAESQTPFPNTITTSSESDESQVVLGSLLSTGLQIRLHQATVNSDTKYVICIEKDEDIAASQEYTKEKEISDPGLLFLLNYLLSNDSQFLNASSKIDAKAQGWIAQTLVWVYQKEVGAEKNTTLTQDQIDKIKKEVKLYLKTDAVLQSPALIQTSQPIYDTVVVKNSSLSGGQMTITQLLAKAKAIHSGQDPWYAFELNISKKSDNVSLTEDQKYYQSDVITVTASSSLVGFKLDISKAPEGTKVFKEDNSEISGSGLDNLPTGTKFYLRVPKDKITEDNKNVAISVTGAFTGDIAYKYVKSGSQSIAYTGKITKHLQKGLDIPFNYTPDIPDTSITVSQSVYFIGLIILLTGVGIIYANIKPSKAQQ